jgi:acyl-coenzyme A thioesterase PaaI-like protein
MASETVPSGGLTPPTDAATLPEPREHAHGPHFPASDGCFGCGPGHPAGLLVRRTGRQDFTFRPAESHQGTPGRTHGGVLAAAMDEAIGMYVWSYDGRYATARLEVDYLLPVPPAAEVDITIISKKGHKSKVYIAAEARLAGKIAIRATALYVRIDDATRQDLGL